MAKEAFGGDDDEFEEEEVKKPDLSRFGLAPDKNIRDTFWKIMASYMASKKPGLDLAKLSRDRLALMYISLSILSRPHNEHYGLAPKFVALYSLKMFLDAGWIDAFSKFLEQSNDKQFVSREEVIHALNVLMRNEQYRQAIADQIKKMLRKRSTVREALKHLVELSDPDLVSEMKTELIILARGDIGENQQLAISLIALIKEDELVRKSIIVLVSHWDAEVRLAAAKILKEIQNEESVMETVALRLKKESDGRIIRILEEISNGRNDKNPEGESKEPRGTGRKNKKQD